MKAKAVFCLKVLFGVIWNYFSCQQNSNVKNVPKINFKGKTPGLIIHHRIPSNTCLGMLGSDSLQSS